MAGSKTFIHFNDQSEGNLAKLSLLFHSLYSYYVYNMNFTVRFSVLYYHSVYILLVTFQCILQGCQNFSKKAHYEKWSSDYNLFTHLIFILQSRLRHLGITPFPLWIVKNFKFIISWHLQYLELGLQIYNNFTQFPFCNLQALNPKRTSTYLPRFCQ